MEYRLLWISGGALIALSAAIHGWSLHARDAGVKAVEQARAQVLREHRPDTTSWSPGRVTAYVESLTQGEPPAALLRIPSLNLTVPVFEDTGEWALNRGAGRIAGTATFNAAGNLGIAGHRDGFFRPLRHIRTGAPLYVETASATYAYRVTQIQIVAPSDVGVLRRTPTPTVTLVTCYPFYYIGPAPQRFIVHAALETTDQAPHVEQSSHAHQ